jgi:hypothetical protein
MIKAGNYQGREIHPQNGYSARDYTSSYTRKEPIGGMGFSQELQGHV